MRLEMEIPPSYIERENREWREEPAEKRARFNRQMDELFAWLKEVFPQHQDYQGFLPLGSMERENPEIIARAEKFARSVLTPVEFATLQGGLPLLVRSPNHAAVSYVIQTHRILKRYVGGVYEADYCVHPMNFPPAIEEATIHALMIRAGMEQKLLSAANRGVFRW